MVHALSHFCFLTFLPTLSFSFFLSFFFLSFLFFPLAFYFFLVFPPSFVDPHYAQLRLFYIACRDKIYHFTLQLLLAGYGALPWPPTGLLAAQPPPLPCAACTTFHSHTKRNFVLFFLLSIAFHLDKGWVPSLTNFYGMHLVIPAHLSLF